MSRVIFRAFDAKTIEKKASRDAKLLTDRGVTFVRTERRIPGKTEGQFRQIYRSLDSAAG
ncbi:MAG: hypothetical protein CMK09_02700 [Ponticaulis sp.]|nr:hypothetical protein [Ponticaulis sp.]|tara:strand:- start:12365 stop:12544 length:180 start_codon:yes stop_codon:yes gene_type:complete